MASCLEEYRRREMNLPPAPVGPPNRYVPEGPPLIWIERAVLWLMGNRSCPSLTRAREEIEVTR